MAPVIAASISNNFKEYGIEINDMDSFIRVFSEEFLAEFTESMQKETIPYYLESFPHSELKEISDFYHTDAG